MPAPSLLVIDRFAVFRLLVMRQVSVCGSGDSAGATTLKLVPLPLETCVPSWSVHAQVVAYGASVVAVPAVSASA